MDKNTTALLIGIVAISLSAILIIKIDEQPKNNGLISEETRSPKLHSLTESPLQAEHTEERVHTAISEPPHKEIQRLKELNQEIQTTMDVAKMLLKLQRESARARNWDQYIELSSQKMGMSKVYAASSISEAIKFRAPRAVFVELQNRGANFVPGHTIVAALSGNVEFFQMLVDLGLDIHAEVAGENALNAVVSVMRDRLMFRYLLTNDLAFNHYKNGDTLVNRALDRGLSNNEAIYYLYYLIEQGATVDAESHEKLALLSTMNNEAYKMLIDKLPNLGALSS